MLGREIINTYAYNQGVSSSILDSYDNINTVIPCYLPSNDTTLMTTYNRRNNNYTVEVDITINKTQPWSNSSSSNNFNVQNAMTHEMGHAIGLADKYESFATEWTMYGSCAYGETKKNSPHEYDIQAMKRLYGLL